MCGDEAEQVVRGKSVTLALFGMRVSAALAWFCVLLMMMLMMKLFVSQDLKES